MTEKLPMNRNREPSPLPACSAALRTLCLGCLDRGPLGGQRAEGGLDLGRDRVAAGSAALDPAGVGDEHEGARLGGWARSAGRGATSPVRRSGATLARAGRAGLPGRLDERAWSEEAVAGGRRPVPAPARPTAGTTRSTRTCGGPAVEADGEGVPGPGPELGGQLVVDDRLAGAGGRAGQPGAALDAAAERGRLGEVDLPDAGPRLGVTARAAAPDHGGLVAAQDQQPVHVGVAAQPLDAPGDLVALGDVGELTISSIGPSSL